MDVLLLMLCNTTVVHQLLSVAMQLLSFLVNDKGVYYYQHMLPSYLVISYSPITNHQSMITLS